MYFYPVYLFSALFVFVLPLFFLFQGIFFSPFQLFFPLLFNSSPLLFFFPLHLNLLFPLVFLFSLSFLYSGLLQIFLFCLLGFLLCCRHFHALKMAVEFRNLPVDIVSFFSGNIEIGMHQLCMYSSCLCNLAFFYCRVPFFQKIAALSICLDFSASYFFLFGSISASSLCFSIFSSSAFLCFACSILCRSISSRLFWASFSAFSCISFFSFSLSIFSFILCCSAISLCFFQLFTAELISELSLLKNLFIASFLLFFSVSFFFSSLSAKSSLCFSASSSIFSFLILIRLRCLSSLAFCFLFDHSLKNSAIIVGLCSFFLTGFLVSLLKNSLILFLLSYLSLALAPALLLVSSLAFFFSCLLFSLSTLLFRRYSFVGTNISKNFFSASFLSAALFAIRSFLSCSFFS